MRKIIHIDMDAFYASVEQRDFPEKYAGRPIAVGGAPPHGVVMTASYEARAAGGVHSAMASVEAERRCPGLVFVPPRMDVYRAVSKRIRAIYEQYTALVEPISLDEAYLDVTSPRSDLPPSATLIARRLKDDIWRAERLTASAGVGRSKFAAKVASDRDKPDGLTVVPPDEEAAFIAGLPIGAFRGVGPVTEEQMRRLGIHTGADLQAKSEPYLQQHFGKRGRFFYRLAQGTDERRVVADRESKSVGAERTFAEGLRGQDEIAARLAPIAARVAERLAAKSKAGRSVTLKLRDARTFDVYTRQTRFPRLLWREEDLYAAGLHLLRKYLARRRPAQRGGAFRLVGLSVSMLAPRDDQARQPRLPFS